MESREVAGGIGELARRPYVLPAPDPEAARKAVSSKGEATVGEACLREEAGDPSLIAEGVCSAACFAEVVRKEVGAASGGH